MFSDFLIADREKHSEKDACFVIQIIVTAQCTQYTLHAGAKFHVYFEWRVCFLVGENLRICMFTVVLTFLKKIPTYVHKTLFSQKIRLLNDVHEILLGFIVIEIYCTKFCQYWVMNFIIKNYYLENNVMIYA